MSGSNLYVGGAFTNAAGMATADYVAEWSGSAWSALGSNGSGDGSLNDTVEALAVSGSNLYVSGLFSDAEGIATADRVAEWNGGGWSGLGAARFGNGPSNWYVGVLALSTSDLYVGGFFNNAAGILEADNVARWTPGSTVVRKPDGRIRLGSGAFVGNNVYNTTGANQTKKGSAPKGHSITFGISIQNDGRRAR